MAIGWHHPVDESDQWDGFNEPGIEHFAGSPMTNVAREVNQNSYDSGDGGMVRVKIRHTFEDTSSIPDVAGLKDAMTLCRAASSKESPKAKAFFEAALEELAKDRISVLEISDFNTLGMRGPATNGTPFYAFMKAKGQSRKDSDSATGSFGIGKFAPYAVSKLRTVFVSTVFEDKDGGLQQLTQGKSILMSYDDPSGKRRQGTGFWGERDRCQPLEGIRDDVPAWVQRADTSAKMKGAKGTKLTILGFDASPGWMENLAATIAENFFGAIHAGKLEVDVNGKHLLNKDSIKQFFDNKDVREAVSKQKDEPDHFDNCGKYYQALQDSPEVIVEETEKLHLGLCELRILIGEGLPKKVSFLRNGMFISDVLSLAGLKSFSDFKEFVAVVECKSTKGIELLRAMEPPRHDDFEPVRLPTKEDQKKGAKALRDLATWIRDMLKRHAKDPVSGVTALDELKEYFADDSGEGAGKGTEEIDPNGIFIIRAKPLKPKAEPQRSQAQGSGGASPGDEGEGGGGEDGAGGGDGQGGSGAGEGGTGGDGAKPGIPLENVRAVVAGAKSRKISFTPSATGSIAICVKEAGADVDYDIAIASSDKGAVKNGKVIVDAVAKQRLSLLVGLPEDFAGALKVVAHEI